MGHRVYFPDLTDNSAGLITITGDEAHHALRVRRLVAGDPVEVLDGEGLVAHTRVQATAKTRDGWSMDLAVDRLEPVPPTMPSVSIASATPKGARIEDVIDGLSQVGATEWRPIVTRRTVVDPREGKLDRLERVAIEAMKQCGRAWKLNIASTHTFKQIVNSVGRVILADASGGPYEPSGADFVTVLIGPEGGWEQGEIDFALNAGLGVKVARFGPHIMRTEVAAVVAACHVLTAEQSLRARAV